MKYTIENDGASVRIKTSPDKIFMLVPKKAIREISVVNNYTVRIDIGDNPFSTIYLNLYDVLVPLSANAYDLSDFINSLLSI